MCLFKMKVKKSLLFGIILTSLFGSACTKQTGESFRYNQLTEVFSVAQSFNPQVDLLWVVDNSASMDAAQEKLRAGIAQFATRYMKPTWDIRVAVITTDTYLANNAFDDYLNTVIPGTVGYNSAYITGRLGTWENPDWNPSFVNLGTGDFDGGIKYKELVPVWGSDYAKLLPGKHDGPITGLCFEVLPYFMNGVTQCQTRDDQYDNTGVDNCLSPGVGESSVTQCVNTVQNDTVRSGKGIIKTKPPEGTPADGAWTTQLIEDFTVNLTPGSVGHGSERGLGSLLQLISDNEGTATSFFRPNTVRGVIFVADEDDQTLRIADPAPADLSPNENYKCDQASLLAMNAGNPGRITGANGYCCDTNGNNCRYGDNGLSCSAKTVDAHTYTVSLCPDPTKLEAVSSIKSSLDDFFYDLDGTDPSDPESDAGYFTVSIVPLTGATIQSLQAQRDIEDANAGNIKLVTVDRGDRYIELGNQVGNGSMSMDIGASDYTPILDAIGDTIISKVGTFDLQRAPTGEEDMIVAIIHADNSATAVPDTDFTVTGKKLQLTNLDFVLGLEPTDVISINYQPFGAE